MGKGGKKVLQFIFLFFIFIILCILLLLVLPYHYDLYFNYDSSLIYRFSFSLFCLHFIFEGDSDGQLYLIKFLNYQKRLITNNNTITGYIKDKSEKAIEKKIKQDNETAKKEKSDRQKKKSNFKFDFGLINRENLNHIFKFVVKMVKILKMDYLKLYLVFSFSDPYYNGIFLAYYYTFKELFDYPDLKVKINWQEVVFEAEASTGGKIIPLNIIWQLLKFIFSIKSLRIFWKLYQLNYKKG